MNWSEYFYYDETSPSCLRWKMKPCRNVRANDVAGYINKRGAWVVKLFGKPYVVHRVIFSIHNETFRYDSVEDIDHIDRNPSNNTIANLRAVSHGLNMRNLSLNINNSSGVTGVNYKEIYDKRKDYLYKAWRAEWRDLNGKNCARMFSTRSYGYDQAFQLACEYRSKMIAELNEQGAGYSETHGL